MKPAVLKARMMTKKLRPQPLPQIMKISPYVPGKLPSKTATKTFKLSSNENPLGASAAARQAVADVTGHFELYPDGGARALREAIGEKYNIDADKIVCGSGSGEILQLLGKAYLTADDEIVQSDHGFLLYTLVAQQAGATTVSAPEKELTTDVDAILECVSEKTKIVFVTNPNNPTGTYISANEMRRLHAGLPDSVLLVIDGAYAEFVREDDFTDGMELVAEFDNVVVTRTFSKVHGLAALRLGWAYGPDHVIDALHRVRGPFNVSEAAQKAGTAAIGDDLFLEQSITQNIVQKERLTNGLSNLGLEPVKSVANFVLARFPETDGNTAAQAAKYLDKNGVSVRAMAGYKLPDCLRITVGTEEGVDAVLKYLKEFLGVA